MALETETFGAFAVGEIPEPALFRWLRPESFGGGPLDISDPSWSIECHIVRPDMSVLHRAGEKTMPEDGRGRLIFANGDLNQEGDFHVIGWAVKGTDARFISKVIVMQVFEPPGYGLEP